MNTEWAFFNMILGVIHGLLGFAALIILIIFLAVRYKPYSLIMPLICFVMGLSGAFLFLLTQNMMLPMVMIDSWTFVHAVILIFQFFLIILALSQISNYKRYPDLYKQPHFQQQQPHTPPPHND